MSPIKDVGGVSHPFPRDPLDRKPEREADVTRIPSSQEGKRGKLKAPSASKPHADQVDISAAGRKLLLQKAEVARYLRELNRQAITDRDFLDSIGQKAQSNLYSKPEVVDKIVESLLALPSFQKAARSSPPVQKSKNREERLDDIRAKLRDGEYDSEAVIDEVVERLLDDLNFRSAP